MDVASLKTTESEKNTDVSVQSKDEIKKQSKDAEINVNSTAKIQLITDVVDPKQKTELSDISSVRAEADLSSRNSVLTEENSQSIQEEKGSLKNTSDIFSVDESKNIPATIFSVGGAPSKTIHRTFSSGSATSASSYETASSLVGSKNQFRNPLTGIGVCSKDEFKNKPSKRKDGNPLLGTGYKDDDIVFNSGPTRRVPPGGYSNGLW